MGTNRKTRKQKHGPNTRENYLAVHRSTLENYSVYAVNYPAYDEKITSDTLSLKTSFEVRTFGGHLVGISIAKVAKVTQKKGRAFCKTINYSYLAYDPAPPRRNLIGYHAPHPHLTDRDARHHPYHHKHNYILDKIELLRGEGDIPFVSEFLDEVLENL